MIEKPTSQGMAWPCFGKWGVIKLIANRAVRLSPINFLSIEDAFLRINRYLPDL
jgi:hypothetical protein